MFVYLSHNQSQRSSEWRDFNDQFFRSFKICISREAAHILALKLRASELTGASILQYPARQLPRSGCGYRHASDQISGYLPHSRRLCLYLTRSPTFARTYISWPFKLRTANCQINMGAVSARDGSIDVRWALCQTESIYERICRFVLRVSSLEVFFRRSGVAMYFFSSSLCSVLLSTLCLSFPAASSPIAVLTDLVARQTNGSDHWVDTWTSMPQLVETANLPPSPFVSFQARHPCPTN